MNYINEINKKNKQGKYSLFSSNIAKNILKNDDQSCYDIIKEWDDKCNLPIELGEFLDKISSDSSNTVAFSRVYIQELNEPGEIKSKEIADIAEYGLINNGHINSSGAYQKINSPSDALTALSGLSGWINLIGRYKGNNATILYSFPSEYIDEDCHFKSDDAITKIYDFSDNLTRFKPEYLIGMIIKNKDGIDIFLSHDDMLNMNTKTI